LIDFIKLRKTNDNISYILVAIDCFTKKVWAYPAKTKTAKEISTVLEKIIRETKVKRIQSDNGGEFVNKTVDLLLSKYNIEFYTTLNDEVKCSMVERVIRTLKTRLFKYFNQKNTTNWVGVLSDVVNAYNSTTHRSTGFAPNQINTLEQNIEIRRKLYGKKIVEKL
jgi:transposase InsO family protein